MLHTTSTPPLLDVLAAAEAVARASTPRRSVTLRDEFGPIRGRRLLDRDTEVLDLDVDELGRSSHRAQIAWAIGG
jgi:hypothetical protein